MVHFDWLRKSRHKSHHNSDNSDNSDNHDNSDTSDHSDNGNNFDNCDYIGNSDSDNSDNNDLPRDERCHFLRVDKEDFNRILRDVEAKTERLKENGKDVLVLEKLSRSDGSQR